MPILRLSRVHGTFFCISFVFSILVFTFFLSWCTRYSYNLTHSPTFQNIQNLSFFSLFPPCFLLYLHNFIFLFYLYRVFKKMLLSNMAASRKREAIHKESKFKAFIKRSSEPLMAMQTQQVKFWNLLNIFYIYKNDVIKYKCPTIGSIHFNWQKVGQYDVIFKAL